MAPGTWFTVPRTVLRILVGNLVESASAYTERISVAVDLDSSGLRAGDAGRSLSTGPWGIGRHGPGLVVVGDICGKCLRAFSVTERKNSGYVAGSCIQNQVNAR